MIAKLILWLYSVIFPQCMVHVYTGPMHDYTDEYFSEQLNADSFARRDIVFKRDFKREMRMLSMPFVYGVACRETP